MPEGVGYRGTLAKLAKLVQDDSQVRKATISDEFARGLGQDYEGRRYREPPAPDATERAIRSQAVAQGTANSDSTDELRNYALLQRQRRAGGKSSAPAVDAAAARQEYERAASAAAQAVNAPATPGAIPEMSPEKAAQLAELEAAKQQAIAAMEAPPPAVDPEKQRLLDELTREGNRTAAEIGAISSRAPGTAKALSSDLDRRRTEILARLATPPATGGRNAPVLSQPGPMSMAQAPQQGPTVASAMPIPPVPPAPPRPVATFPLVAPPVYPPSPGYPTPPPVRTADLDAAAAREYARTRLGIGGP